MTTESFTNRADQVLQKLLDFYAPHFSVARNEQLDGIPLAARTEYHNRAERTLLGIKLNSLGNESNEYGLYVTWEAFDRNAFEAGVQLLQKAEQELVKVHREHAMSLLSLVVLADRVSPEAAAALKKYSLQIHYPQQGWCSARYVVLEVDSGTMYCNKEGKILKNLLQKALDGKPL